MATDAAISEPQFDAIFTDRGWRAAFAGRTGVVCDTDGSAFGLTLPAEGATAELGSATLPSRLVVDGYGLEVAQGATQSLDIPASSGGGTNGRTDLIVARLDLSTFTGSPGPVRLDRVPGTEGSLARPAPTYDPDGVRDLPLYAVRRRQGESLNQAIVTDLRPRIGHHYLVPPGGTMPAASLGDRATRDSVIYRYDLVGGTPDWAEERRPRQRLTGGAALAEVGANFQVRPETTLDRDGIWRTLTVVVRRTTLLEASSWGNLPEVPIARAFSADRPSVRTPMAATARTNTTAGPAAMAGVHMADTGWIYLNSLLPNAVIVPSGPNDTITATATWCVAP